MAELFVRKREVWRLPSGNQVRVISTGLFDIELQYMNSKHGEVFFVLRAWMLRYAECIGSETCDKD